MKKFLKKIKGKDSNASYAPYADIFKKLDVEGTAQQLTLSERGRVAGQAEKPPTRSNSNDAVENRIISIIEDEKDQSYDESIKWFTAYRDRLKALGIETSVQRLGEGKKKVITDIRATLETLTDSDLYKNSRDITNKSKDLVHFREVNLISREPHYSESKILGFSILFLVFLLESGLNAYFFAKGHELGYLGGFSVAVIISVVNIVFNSFLLGWFFLRQIIHRHWGRKIVGFISLLFFLISAPGFNLAVAHYRQAFVLQADNPGKMAIDTLFAAPLRLYDFDSYMLIFMGLAVCIVVCIDLWSMYDPYPGYEKRHKKLDELQDDYLEKKSNLVVELQNIRDDSFNEIEATLHQLESRQEDYRSLIEKMGHLKSQIEPHFSRLEQNGRELLAIYRDANAQTRTTPSPKRWLKEYVLPRPNLDSFLLPSSIDVSAILADARDQIPIMIDNINMECRKAIEGIELLSNIEKNSRGTN